MEVIIRDLQPNDAKISYKWRNDPEVWKQTGRKWNNLVTEEIEEQWIRAVIKKPNEKRFAICVGKDLKYIGNVQLTGITKIEGTFHIFIGDKEFWGKGIGTKATQLILSFAKRELSLHRVNLFVKKGNIAAIKVYEKVGFKSGKTLGEDILMTMNL